MGKKGNLIVIESNDKSMKGAVVDELFRRMQDCHIFFKRMNSANRTVKRLEVIAKEEFGRNLDWLTSFMFAESSLLETLSACNDYGVGKIASSGGNVLIDQFDASIYVDNFGEDKTLNNLFHTVNNNVVSMFNPKLRIFLATSKSNLSKKEGSDYIKHLDKYLKFYSRLEEKGQNVKIVHISDQSFNETCNQIEKIIRDLVAV